MIYTAIDTFYLTAERLRSSPSRRDGIGEEAEAQLRLYGCDIMQEAGILLRLYPPPVDRCPSPALLPYLDLGCTLRPQAVMATGQVLFHRFYCKKSFKRFNVKRVAASCIWLAAKLEESPRRIRDVVNVFYRVDLRRHNLPLVLLEPLSKQYDEMKTDLIRTERHLLKEMGFVCHVEHPHKYIFNYLNQLGVADELKQDAWSLANDSLRTTLCVRVKSEVIACGIIHAAARRKGIPLPENPPWWLAFDAAKEGIDEVCASLADLYARPKPEYVEVNKGGSSFVLSTRAWEPPAEIPQVSHSLTIHYPSRRDCALRLDKLPEEHHNTSSCPASHIVMNNQSMANHLMIVLGLPRVQSREGRTFCRDVSAPTTC
eukprot:SM000050S17068  [mRNA]  locus=s50:757989:760403:- [translate_table: standard]